MYTNKKSITLLLSGILVLAGFFTYTVQQVVQSPPNFTTQLTNISEYEYINLGIYKSMRIVTKEQTLIEYTCWFCSTPEFSGMNPIE